MGSRGYFDWCKERHIVEASKGVILAKSSVDDPDPGNGLYLISCKEDKDIVLRIPREYSFSIFTVLNLLENSKNYSDSSNHQRTLQKVKSVLRDFQNDPRLEVFLSEKTLLIFYFILFDILKDDYEISEVLLNYLTSILKTVSIDNSTTDGRFYHGLYAFYSNVRAQESFIRTLYTFFQHTFPDCTSITQEHQARHLTAAIISRDLEIPKEIEPLSKDFTVSTSLVPVLDFINHSLEPNAHFDIDRTNNDIILRVDREKINNVKGSQISQHELFISYDTTEEAVNFVSQYGFIPKTCSFFNVSIDRNWFHNQYSDFYCFCKWFKINPVFQVQLRGNQWTIDGETIAELAFWLMMENSDMQLNYDNECYDTLAFIHTAFLTTGEESGVTSLLKDYKNAVESQELDLYEDFIQFPQVAWTVQNETGEVKRINRESLFSKFKELTGVERDQVIEDTVDFIKEYLDYRLNQLEIELTEEAFDVGSGYLEAIKFEFRVVESILEGGTPISESNNESLALDKNKPTLPFPLRTMGKEEQDGLLHLSDLEFDVTRLDQAFDTQLAQFRKSVCNVR